MSSRLPSSPSRQLGTAPGLVSCPVCQARHVPFPNQPSGGVFASQCQQCCHVFKFRASAPTKSTVTFTVNGKQYTAGNEHSATTSLNQFLRQNHVSFGTKFMCREGGCGCCTVAVMLTNPVDGKTESASINSCLCPLFVCDGWTITTVEGIGQQRTGLHPIQQHLVDYNGSQCGFCSPGMVMTMYSLLENNPSPTKRFVEDAFDGNICRCTGYRPILDAMKSFAKQVPDIEDIRTKVCKKTGKPCEGGCSSQNSLHILSQDAQWYRPTSLSELYQILGQHKTESVRLTFGSTASGVYGDLGPWNYQVIVDIHAVKELSTIAVTSTLDVGANLTLANLIQLFFSKSTQAGYSYLSTIGSHLSRVAQSQVRNVGSWAGNLVLKQKHPEFPSDVFILLEAVGATLTIGPNSETVTPLEFLSTDMTGRVVEQAHLPTLPDKTYVRTYRVAPRTQNCQAYVNGALRMRLDKGPSFTVLEQPSLVFGGISKTLVHATKTEQFLTGKQLGDQTVLQGALNTLFTELLPDDDPVFGSAAYKKQLAVAFLYKVKHLHYNTRLAQRVKPEQLSVVSFRFLFRVNSEEDKVHIYAFAPCDLLISCHFVSRQFCLVTCSASVDPKYVSGGNNLVRPVSSGQQSYDTQKMEWPITEPLPKLEAKAQATGEAEYINDIPPIDGQLYGTFVLSTEGNAQIQTIDPSAALKIPGVVKFISASDIPGENNCSPFGAAEEIFCSGKVEYAGQALGLIIAESLAAAEDGARSVKVTYSNVQAPIVSIQDAIDKKSFFPKPGDVVVGNAEDAIAKSPKSVTGSVSMSSQYHFHLETHISQCTPTEGGMSIVASTQFPDGSQTIAAKALGEPVSSIDLSVRRLGGGFGAKILKNCHVTAACAVAARLTIKPVRLMEGLGTNMEMVGKRPAYRADYQVGFTEDGQLNGVKIIYYCDSGYSPNGDTSPTATQFGDNVYHCDNWHMIPTPVKTNCPGHTAVRGPGATPGIFIMETIIEHVAKSLGKDPTAVKILNLYKKGQTTPTGMYLPYCSISDLMTQLDTSAQVSSRVQQVQQFNQANRWKKKGLSVVPVKYGILWEGGYFNSLVAIYNGDGTVAVNHGGVEMGQGINTKVSQVCARILGIPMDLVKIKPTDTLSAANTGVTGGSVGSELTCKAVMECCQMLVARMAPVKAKMKDPTWLQLVQKCFSEGIDLTARYWLFPKTQYEFQYNSYGVACSEVEFDVLTGEYLLNRVDILFDCGESINPALDIGQVEGAFVFGLGFHLLEETLYDPKTGQNITSDTWTYKPPSSKDIPVDFRIQLLKNAPNPLGVLKSKAVGEPPLCLSSSALFALKHAIEAARKDAGQDTPFVLNSPATVARLQENCLTAVSQFVYKP
ncbi:LOW QUALITY PROTEIN: xanthine dehydrogenase-like [Liolophura sinensis]|uniref:LOW QUALITY PROTEIN: xanthine dehydrogenase-like n=1 Tax=Liolophura sinensis TaxID=3198878 RepID=UPI0031586B14